MSRKEREEWQARLAADPALNAAWDQYRNMLGRMTVKNPLTFTRRDLEEMRDTVEQLLAVSGSNKA